LSNVANVVIPSGVQVQFDTIGAVSPADASQAVNIIGLGNAGSLTQANGTLNIGTGGMTLAGYTQNGGVLTNAGETHLGSFNQSAGSFGGTGGFTADRFSQSGGSTALAGDFTLLQGFQQGASGTVTVGGNTLITDTSGGIPLGNLSTAGTTSVVSFDGAIIQPPGAALESGGAASFTASNGAMPPRLFDIHLDGANNDFQSTLTLVGNNATVNAGGPLVVTLNVAGDSTLASSGNLSISGNAQNLTTTTTAGDIVQHGPLVVSGSSSFNAIVGDVLLMNEDNRLQSGVQANGRLVNIKGDMQGDEQKAAAAAAAAASAAAAAAAAATAAVASNASGQLALLPAITDNFSVVAVNIVGSIAAAGSGSALSAAGSGITGVQVEMREKVQSDQGGVVSVTLPPDSATSGTGFVFSLPEELIQKMFEPVTWSLEDGSALPAWLSFNPKTGEFTAAAVPDRAFPIHIHISWSGQKVIVVISERKI
jgi:hypothetical protein